MGVKLLASDLDGTLLQNGIKKPTEEAIGLIRELRAKGIMFAAASGRQYNSLRRIFEPVADDIAYVCENGCLTVYQNEILYQANFPRERAEEIYDLARSTEHQYAIASGAKYTYVSLETPELVEILEQHFNYSVQTFEKFSDIPEEIIKVSVFCDTGAKNEDVEVLREHFGDIATVASSGTLWIDLMPKNITKQIGLEKLAEHLNISIEDCMAVGDEHNDYEMLKAVGHPVAMNNARTAILELCPQHTDSVENLMRSLL